MASLMAESGFPVDKKAVLAVKFAVMYETIHETPSARTDARRWWWFCMHTETGASCGY